MDAVDLKILRTRTHLLEDFIIRRAYPDELYDCEEDFETVMSCYRAQGEDMMENEWREERCNDIIKTKYAPSFFGSVFGADSTGSRTYKVVSMIAVVTVCAVFWYLVSGIV